MTNYQPIDCGQHSEYELAIMRGQKLRMQWTDLNGNQQLAVVKPVDVFSKNHEEFLRVISGQTELEIRLDYIKSAEIENG